MFYPVKILDGKGKIKKWISSKSLNERHWKGFFEKTGKDSANFNEYGGLKRRGRIIDVYYEPTFTDEY